MSGGLAGAAPNLLQQRIEAIALAIVVSVLIFELVRRRHLMERYAILWLVAGLTVLVLALWKGLLSTLAHAVGIYYTPSALFAVTFLFVILMLVHFSMTISRLSDQNTILAQRLALLQARLDAKGGDRVGNDRGGERQSAAPAPEAPGAE
jgi:hypothetical protein